MGKRDKQFLLNMILCHSIGGIILSKFSMVTVIFLLFVPRHLFLWILETIAHRGYVVFF
jgi:hypothetical protein